jgi:hypothetical protein
MLLPPFFDLLPGIFQAQELMDVEALIPERSVEQFDMRVIGGLAGTREVHAYPVLVGPSGYSEPADLFFQS